MASTWLNPKREAINPNKSANITGARRPSKNRSEIHPVNNVPAQPNNGKTADLNAAELALAPICENNIGVQLLKHSLRNVRMNDSPAVMRKARLLSKSRILPR